jgi:hypothetical protein
MKTHTQWLNLCPIPSDGSDERQSFECNLLVLPTVICLGFQTFHTHTMHYTLLIMNTYTNIHKQQTAWR